MKDIFTHNQVNYAVITAESDEPIEQKLLDLLQEEKVDVRVTRDIVFVVEFSMGASGAALATVLAQAVSVDISIFVIRCKKCRSRLTVKICM